MGGAQLKKIMAANANGGQGGQGANQRANAVKVIDVNAVNQNGNAGQGGGQKVNKGDAQNQNAGGKDTGAGAAQPSANQNSTPQNHFQQQMQHYQNVFVGPGKSTSANDGANGGGGHGKDERILMMDDDDFQKFAFGLLNKYQDFFIR